MSTAIIDLLKEMDGYIQQSAEEACAYLLNNNNLTVTPFPGTTINIDKNFCVNIYKDLITELVNNKKVALFKYGMFAMVMAFRTHSSIAFGINLGICFPDISQKTKLDEDQSSSNTPHKDEPPFD